MMGRRFLGIQTVISGENPFFRTIWGAILGLMRLNFRLSVRLPQDEVDATMEPEALDPDEATDAEAELEE